MNGEKEKKAPDTTGQDKPKEKILGKFDSYDEMMQAYKDAEKKLTELSEKVERQERLLELLQDDTGGGSSPVPAYEPAGENDDPSLDTYLPEGAEWLKNILDAQQKQLEKKFRNELLTLGSYIEQKMKAEQKFYAENPDLRGHEDLVEFEAQRLLQELGGKQPKNPEKFAKLIAARVRERITRIKSEQNGRSTPPYVEGSASKAPEGYSPEPENEVSEEDYLKEYLNERNSLAERKRV